ncbi:MAG: insulinase family protein [Planctomycetota bacterium]
MMKHASYLSIIICLALLTPVWGDAPLPRDPNNVYGQFENGFSYIIRVHDNPPGRVGVYLHLDSGALNETEEQNGIAHFMEHLAFNGSKHFAPGELIPYLNKLGMAFGQHTNAHTNREETVFKLIMPDVEEATIEKAMTIMSDYAYGLLLSQEEIDKERGVILEEARASKGARERIQKEMMRLVFEGTRFGKHDVIGDEEQIAGWNRDAFLDYYNTWYRPENMTLIVVGEIDPKRIVEMAKATFGSFKSRAPERKPLGSGVEPVNKARAFVLTDPEQVMGQVQLLAIKEGRPPMQTYDDYRFNETENLGTWIVSRRLEEMVNKGTAAFMGGGVSVSSIQHDAILPIGSAVGQPEDWNKMLDQVVVETARAIEHGFTQREFKLAKEALLSNAERAVEQEPTMDARAFLSRFSSSVGSQERILSATQRLELIKKIIDDVKLDEVHRVFVDNFKTRNYSYVMVMPEKKEGLTLPTSEDVLAAAAAAWARKTEPIEEEKAVDGILEKLPEPGKVAEQSTDADLKITTATLSNGAIVHHRFMDYKKDQVMVRITFWGGELLETAENRGVSEVAGLAFDQPATSRLSSTQTRDLMTGKKVGVRGSIGQDAVVVMVDGSPKDLEVGMQLAYALLADGVVEESAFDTWKKATLQDIEESEKTTRGQLHKALQSAVWGGDVRLSDLTAAQVERLSAKAGQAWFKTLTATAPVEVAIVGDISLEDGMKLVTRYVGGLPQRKSNAAALDAVRKVDRGDGPYTKKTLFESITPQAMVLAGFVSCDDRDTLDRRLLVMAARILSDRMIEVIREKERLVYGIGCQNIPGEAIPGLGMMFGAAPTDPEKADMLADRVLEMLREFAEKGPTDEEVATAKKQIANMLDTSLKEPGFWTSALQEFNYRGKTLDELKELPDVYQTFTAKQLQDVVKKYMKDDKIIRLVIIPEEKEKAAEEAPAKPEGKAPAEEKEAAPVGR